jgi:hypothetical protein
MLGRKPRSRGSARTDEPPGTGTLAGIPCPGRGREPRAHSSAVEHSPYKRGVRRFKSYCAHFFSNIRRRVLADFNDSNKLKIYLAYVGQELCGARMPRAKTTCARTPGHGGSCMTAANMANRRDYNRHHGHRESPESRKKSNRKYRIASYGLTQEQFASLLDAQQHACGMCHEVFEDGQLIHVDHDHACCQRKNRSCGKCIRGLLCHVCNIALGYIEHRYTMARAYLDCPPIHFLAAA